MKDYKLSEIKQICTDQASCEMCPINKLCNSCFDGTIILPWQWDLTEVDKEETFYTTSASTSDEPLTVEVNTPDEFIIYTPFIYKENKNDK